MEVEARIVKAAEILRSGGLVAFPTETVYGLGADAENEIAVRRIFAVKGRPLSHPVIVHVASAAALSSWAKAVPKIAFQLAEAFWPGALTLVLHRQPHVLDVVTGGQETVAIRVPAAELAQALLQEFKGGIAAPSANRFGRVSPTSAEHVRADLDGDVDFILDGGPCSIGVESTIVDLSGNSPAILRPGGVSKEDLEQVLGFSVPLAQRSQVRVPGVLPAHYAPKAEVLLVGLEDIPKCVKAERALGKRVAVLAPASLKLPAEVAHFETPDEPEALARTLYATLREIDQQGFEVIVAAPPPDGGLGLAVRDRLARAAGLGASHL